MKRGVIIVGYSELVRDLLDSIAKRQGGAVNFRGIIADVDDKVVEAGVWPQLVSIPVIGRLKDIRTLLAHDPKGEKPILVIAVGEERDNAFIHDIAHCISYGYEIYEIVDVYEMLTGKVPVLHIREKWLLHAFNRPRLGYSLFKRIVDFVGAIVGLIVLSPVLLLVVLAILVSSPGPVFYRQLRVGLGGRTFSIFKFRTMVTDAEENDPQWAVKNDPRVTAIGRLLRRMRLDEIPQLINVLKGEMSLIGPRPERPEFVRRLDEEIPFYSYRHMVRPGITGWAQVCFRYACSIEDSLHKLQYDLYGIRNASAFHDIEVFFRTIWVVLSGAGAH